MKKREANFELLRIVAMLMIITLHYLSKGAVLPDVKQSFTWTGYLAWGLEALCVPAVNVYVLISAYFLIESGFRWQKTVRLWLQVFFYSAGIALVCVLTGIVPAGELDAYRCMTYLFPVIEEHYWFATAYILMYLIAPFLNEGLCRISQKTYCMALCILLLILSVSKSILPVSLPTDRLGYDAVWFLCLYMLGGYLKLYGIPVLKRRGSALFFYFASCGLIFASLLMVRFFYLATGSLGEFISRQYQYNSLFCLSASVALFAWFEQIKISCARVEKAVIALASASFGVYLIHEHLELRYLWPVWFGVEKAGKTPFFLLHWAVTSVVLYLTCAAVDLVRQRIFMWAQKRICKERRK